MTDISSQVYIVGDYTEDLAHGSGALTGAVCAVADVLDSGNDSGVVSGSGCGQGAVGRGGREGGGLGGFGGSTSSGNATGEG